MKKIILMLIAITTIACACKKYEEGPCISLRSAENRIIGSWDLTELSVDGFDKLDLYYDSLGKDFEFLITDDHLKVCRMYGPKKDGGGVRLYWIWRLFNEKKILKIENTYGTIHTPSWGPFKVFVRLEWEILRLTNREMKLRTIYNGSTYVIFLENK